MTAIVIIGAGECGTRAAFELRERGWQDRIVLIGAEPGLPYERPPLSKPTSDGVSLRLVCDDIALRAAGIEYFGGVDVETLDRAHRCVRLADGRSVAYAKVLLATGARPRPMHCPGGDRALTFRTLPDAETLYRRTANAAHVAVVGAGLIGMELAATLRTAGIDVTVIEAGPRPLGRGVPEALAARLHARHCDEGVRFLFNAGVSSIDGDTVALSDGTTVTADVVVAAIGVLPDTSLAERAGLAVDNGIVVDATLATLDPDVFAAGDCARVPSRYANGVPLRLESWRNAREQGAHAAKAMLGDAAAFDAVPWFWSDQYDLGLQVVGIPVPGQRNVVRRLSSDAELLFQLADDGSVRCASGLGVGNRVARDIRLAEMLIARRVRTVPEVLQDPAADLRSLIRQ
ncbi:MULTISPECIES: NAD(P)/FAD-dependent oxidoreductase [unclassified Burkholderia]|uniref:NAD(P)/FAD-dependent oxidoreductase n=1 Tax=unclassified Burkholderia TaxID=2613784 RepID=UPI000F561A72|nr:MULTISPECIES: FAD-dependent oxidoreductase [unclassified Burkholderia]RQR72393.1 ferredoxin reductase [Burkholderia sp. Bp9011]RQR84648.1 ferredoxin reductase [Burkholderia sp. Bp9010]RQS65639.1 ferredoxin reductase [Burkholderia sp. Bp8977]